MVLASVILFCLGIDPHLYGLNVNNHCYTFMGDSIINRASYMFLHGNIFHLILNAWSLLALVFYYNPPRKFLLTSFCIAFFYPAYYVNDINFYFVSSSVSSPIIGLSGFIYALLGILFFTFSVRRKLLITLLIYSIFGLIVGSMAVGLHLWCFYLGIIVSLITTDIFD